MLFLTAGAGALSTKCEEIPLGYPRPTLNYRRGAPMCAPVIHGTGFIPLSSKPSVLPPSPLGRLNKIHLPLGKGGLPSGKAFIKEKPRVFGNTGFFYENYEEMKRIYPRIARSEKCPPTSLNFFIRSSTVRFFFSSPETS